MPESRVLELNEKNLAEQKKLRKEHGTTTTASKAPKGGAKDGAGGSSSTRGTRKDGPRGTKRSREEVRIRPVAPLCFTF